MKKLNESSLSRIWGAVEEHEAGAITAFRADRKREVNQKFNSAMKIYLRSKGYSVTAIDGNYIENFGEPNQVEVSEPSYFVVDINDTGNLHSDLIALGRMFGQDSVLIVERGGEDAYLVGTTGRQDAWLGLGEKVRVGSGKYGQVAGAFLSRIRGRPFAFEQVELPPTINGKRVWKILESKIEENLKPFRENLGGKVVDTIEDLKRLSGIS